MVGGEGDWRRRGQMISLQIVGLQGVGKSTVSRQLRNSYPQFAYYDYADFMLEALGYGDKDTLGKLTHDQRAPLFSEANRLLQEFMDTEPYKLLVMESHAAVELPNGEILRFSEHGFEESRTKAMVILVADPSAIHARRAQDETRQRDVGLVEAIERFQNENTAHAIEIARVLAIPHYVVRNDDRIRCGKEMEKIMGEILRRFDLA